MASGDPVPPKEFPDVTHKLAAPKKLSAFEKEREAARAKERRAEAENAAALREFQDAFAEGQESEEEDGVALRRPPRGAGPGHGGPGGRYGGGTVGNMPRSGPGSLDFSSGGSGLPPPMSLKRKRALDEMREMQQARRESDMLGGRGEQSAFQTEQSTPSQSASMRADAEEQVEAPRPTLHLSSMPPTTSISDIRDLLHTHVAVHQVSLLPNATGEDDGKRSLAAIVTLDHEVPTSQIDAAVSSLKDKYLGCGFRLSLFRHLSSAAMHPALASTIPGSNTSNEPFGAERPRDQTQNQRGFSMRNAPPPRSFEQQRQHGGPQNRAFAPPDSYNARSDHKYTNHQRNQPNEPLPALVAIKPPTSLAELRAIHTLVDRLLSEPSPAHAMTIEHALMNLPSVQNDERFAFLFDATSQAGKYYRYLLWTSSSPEFASAGNFAQGERIFEDVPLLFVPEPVVGARKGLLPFMDLRSLGEAINHEDYDSSAESSSSDSESERKRKFNRGGRFDNENDPATAASLDPAQSERNFLTPLSRAHLVHLLARLPQSHAKLRRGDVARVTHFAMKAAAKSGSGAEEVVEALVGNVLRPFSLGLASRYEDDDEQANGHGDMNGKDSAGDAEDAYEPEEELEPVAFAAPTGTEQEKDIPPVTSTTDPSSPTLIALHLLTDILSASSTAGARNAWKYRSLVQSLLQETHVFERLGGMERAHGWGKMRSEQWRRRVEGVLGVWSTGSYFDEATIAGFKAEFQAAAENVQAKNDAEDDVELRARNSNDAKGKFRPIEAVSKIVTPGPLENDIDVDGEPMDDDVDGKPMNDDVDGEPMDHDVDGTPMPDDDVDGAPMTTVETVQQARVSTEAPEAGTAAQTKLDISLSAGAKGAAGGPKKRMRAEDMFADSDED